jgi:membrane-bound lytic murein transglycosylase B
MESHDDYGLPRPPLNSSRRRLRRAMLALAGGGLTAAGLGGPLSGGALAATALAASAGTPAGTGGSTEDTVTSSSASTPAPSGPAQGGGAGETTTTTTASTPAAPTSTATSPTATATPAPTPTPAAGSAAGATPTAPSGPAGNPSSPAASAPTVVVQRTQPARPKRRGSKTGAQGGSSAQGQQGTGAQQGTGGLTAGKGAGGNSPATVPPGTPNGVAQPPQVVAAQAGTLASLLGQSTVSAQALEFYRVPLFLLPIYQAAGIQYGVPWQILAAINEVETDYGNDLSVSTAGAVGWMQFMPETWLQYGVDALGAGYADPYNPVDAIFAAARYLHAAGASSNLHTAILAYNHSEAYVESVLLRAKLIAAYPQSVIATLTGLTEGRLPVAGARIVQDPASVAPAVSSSSATAGAVAVEDAAAGASFGTAGSAPGASGAAAGAASGTGSQAAGTGSQGAGTQGSTSGAPTPGSTDAPTPAAAASGLNLPASPAASAQGSTATGSGKSRKPQEELHFVDLLGTPGEAVTAVEDGRIVKLGRSHRLGNYLALQDIYGDIFTYAGLGSIAPRYHVADLADPADSGHSAANAGQKSAAQAPDSARGTTGVVATPAVPLPLAAAAAKASAHAPKPALPASAGSQPPLTLHVKVPHARAVEPEAEEQPAAGSGAVPAGMGKVRLYAHPGNPVARVAAVRAAQNSARDARGPWLPLRVGSVVSQGTVLGHLKGLPGQSAAALNVPPGSQAVGSLGAAGAARTVRLRFAIRPAGDSTTVDAQPILRNWRQLDVALHPKGSKGTLDLLDATAAQVFLMSQSELERTVLSDSGIDLGGCGRQDVASGAVDGRVLAVLEFLSRSGLRPTVSAMRCSEGRLAAASSVDAAHRQGTAVDISAINGIAIAGHQGAGSITDLTIRTLLTLQGRFQPRQILSLMKYPDARNTLADATQWNHIHVDFRPLAAALAPNPAASATVAHSAGAAGQPAPAPQAVTPELSAAQWDALVARIGSLQEPTVSAKPSASAIRDPQAAAGNRGLGSGALPFGSGSESGSEE